MNKFLIIFLPFVCFSSSNSLTLNEILQNLSNQVNNAIKSQTLPPLPPLPTYPPLPAVPTFAPLPAVPTFPPVPALPNLAANNSNLLNLNNVLQSLSNQLSQYISNQTLPPLPAVPTFAPLPTLPVNTSIPLLNLTNILQNLSNQLNQLIQNVTLPTLPPLSNQNLTSCPQISSISNFSLTNVYFLRLFSLKIIL